MHAHCRPTFRAKMEAGVGRRREGWDEKGARKRPAVMGRERFMRFFRRGVSFAIIYAGRQLEKWPLAPCATLICNSLLRLRFEGREREIYIYGCYGCRASDRIKTFIADRASMRIEEGKKRKKEEEEECFGPGLTGIISDTVLSVDAVWARGPTERRAGDLWPRLSLSLECIVAGCYVKYGRVPEVKNNKRRKRKTYIYIYVYLRGFPYLISFPVSQVVLLLGMVACLRGKCY